MEFACLNLRLEEFDVSILIEKDLYIDELARHALLMLTSKYWQQASILTYIKHSHNAEQSVASSKAH